MIQKYIMNLAAEKEEIVKWMDNMPPADEALEKELDLAIKEADNGELVSYEEVLVEFRKKYSA